MSVQGDLETAIQGALVTALGASVPVGILVDPVTLLEQRYPLAVSIVLGRDAAEPSDELGQVVQQHTWSWLVYVVCGQSEPRTATSSTMATTLDTLEAALAPRTQFKPDSYCGPMEYVGREFVGFHPMGVIYLARFQHIRWTG